MLVCYQKCSLLPKKKYLKIMFEFSSKIGRSQPSIRKTEIKTNDGIFYRIRTLPWDRLPLKTH
jgi:hypothetical protein